MSSVQQPLLDTIEPDEDVVHEPTENIKPSNNERKPVVLTPTSHVEGGMASTPGDAEAGIAGIFRQSSHPVALLFLYLFRTAAIAVYILCELITYNYVLSTVLVVVLLAMDFWNCRNISGRTLVGLRYWNQVDDDGESYWVFESRDPSRPANPIDAKMFWIALYTFPALWVVLLLVAFVKLNFSFVPIVILALVFNGSNAVGFTYADRDAKQRWANAAAGGFNFGIGNLGGQLLASAVKSRVGKIFG